MPAPTADQPRTSNRRTSLLNFRVLPAERQQLMQLAAAQGTTLSELVRRALQSQGFQPQR
jgi:predicted HicB family RNase H-like nuclease